MSGIAQLRREDAKKYKERLQELAQKPLTLSEFRTLQYYWLSLPKNPAYNGRDGLEHDRLFMRGYLQHEIDDKFPIPVVRVKITPKGQEAYQVKVTEMRLAQMAKE